jgi:hypothetical protein
MQNNTPGQGRIRELRAMSYDKYLQTPEWAHKRDQALERDDYRCRACNIDKKLQVHHRTYARRGNEDLNDLTTLCESCHEHFHRKISQMEIMGRTYEAPHEPVTKETQAQKLEDYLIGLLIQNPSLQPYVAGLLSGDDFISANTSALYRLLGSGQPFEQCVPSELKIAMSRAIDVFNADPLVEGDRQIKSVVRLAAQIKCDHLLRKHEGLRIRLREAANEGDRITERQLREEMQEIKKLQRTLYLSGGR